MIDFIRRQGLIGLLSLCSTSAWATQTSVPFFECAHCTDAQMRQAALDYSGLGVRIVYNLDSAHIFKYNVYMEAGCLNGGGGGSTSGSSSTRASTDTTGDSGASTQSTCNTSPTREIEQLTVDAALQAPFASMVQLHAQNSAVLATSHITQTINSVGNDPDGRLYDPRQVAWDRDDTGNSFNNFMDSAQNWADTASLSDPDSDLFAYLSNNILRPLLLASISVSGSPSLSLNLTDLHPTIVVDFTAPDGSVIRVQFIFDHGDYTAQFVFARDSSNVTLPTSTEAMRDGFNRRYPTGHDGDANRLGDQLHNMGGYTIIGSGVTCYHGSIVACTNSAAGTDCHIYCQ